MRNLLLITLAFFIVENSISQNYNIKIKVKGISEGEAYLGHYYGDSQYVIDTAQINNKGVAIFKGNKRLDGGTYLVLFPQREMSYFEILMGDIQDFTIETDTLGFYQKNIKSKGSIVNQEFFKFKKDEREFGLKMYNLRQDYNKYKDNKDSLKVIIDNIKQLSKDREQFLAKTVEKSKTKTLKTVVNLMREIEVPEFEVPENIKNKDSLIRINSFNYYKNHFWDYTDFSDSTILRTQMFDQKLKQYMTKVIFQRADTIIKEGHNLVEKAKGNNQVFKYMAEYMLGFADKSQLMGMDKVFVETAKKYYISGQATWADSSRLSKIKSSVEKIEPNLVGNYAPDLQRLESWDNKYYTLYDLKNEYTVIAFWEPHCGHCKVEIPKLYKAYEKLKKAGVDVEVIAFYTQIDKEPWVKFIEDKEITDWINIYDKYQFTNFRKLYNVYATPTIYLLDKNKKIIAKRLGAEQIEKFLLNIDKIKKGEKPIK